MINQFSKLSNNSLNNVFFPLIEEINKRNGNLILAIEGGSASGKTTLADFLKKNYDCTVFHMDDFFLRPEQRTKKRLEEPGGNVDKERFLEEVLFPLSKGNTVFYKKFDCKSMSILPPIEISPKAFTIIEGAYCMHPSLSDYYDFSVFLQVDSKKQKERIICRNTESQAKAFFEKWIPLENRYFETFDIKNKCNIIINV